MPPSQPWVPPNAFVPYSRHWIFVSEYMYRIVQPSDSAQQMTIEDMKGVKIQVSRACLVRMLASRGLISTLVWTRARLIPSATRFWIRESNLWPSRHNRAGNPA